VRAYLLSLGCSQAHAYESGDDKFRGCASAFTRGAKADKVLPSARGTREPIG